MTVSVLEKYKERFAPKQAVQAEQVVKQVDREAWLSREDSWSPSLYELFRKYGISLSAGEHSLRIATQDYDVSLGASLSNLAARVGSDTDPEHEAMIGIEYVKRCLLVLMDLDGNFDNDLIASTSRQVPPSLPRQNFLDVENHFDAILKKLEFANAALAFRSDVALKMSPHEREYYKTLSESSVERNRIRDALLKQRVRLYKEAREYVLSYYAALEADENETDEARESKLEVIKEELAALAVESAADFRALHYETRRELCDRAGIPAENGKGGLKRRCEALIDLLSLDAEAAHA